MIKTIDISGIQLDNYPVRESIMQMDKEMVSQTLSTVVEVTMDMLLLAQSDERVRKALESATHTIVIETGILEAAGESTMQRKREIENHTFFFELMKRIERNHKRIFLLGERKAQMEEFEMFLKEEFPRCDVEGIAAIEDCAGTFDSIINEMNAATADVVISILPSPQQQYFLLDNRDRLSASLWYCMDVSSLTQTGHRILHWIRRHIRKKRLEEHMVNYGEKTEGNE